MSWLAGFLVSRFLDFRFLVFLVSKLLGVLVSWFVGFVVSWVLGCKVDWLIRFTESEFRSFKIHLMHCLMILFLCYQQTMSCFLEGIDPIFKMFKKFQDGSSWFVGVRLFHNVQNIGLFDMSIFPRDFYLISLRSPGVSKDKNYWLWENRKRSKKNKSWTL